ncbi:MAG: sugar transferase [Finegoldia magna]|nr:sugar transferase [Finegoldia magna]
MYEKYFKRVFDIILSFVGLVILSPVLIVLAFLVKAKLGSPVIFSQERPGKNEKIFKLYKFRTMTDEKDDSGKLLADEQRLTTFGKKLRSTSLDELPELVNILKGDMSIVGPRPLAKQYLPFYNLEEKQRHDVLPGLTGLAQINGRNASNWPERFKFDIEYAKNITFRGDFKIILTTIRKVLKKEDVIVRGSGETIDFNIYRMKEIEEKSKHGN